MVAANVSAPRIAHADSPNVCNVKFRGGGYTSRGALMVLYGTCMYMYLCIHCRVEDYSTG